MRRIMRSISVAIASVGALSAASAFGQTTTGGAIGIELNRVDQIDTSCRFTFLAENSLGVDATALTLETVIIDTDGVVAQLTLFEFGDLPNGVPRVRQFDVPSLECAGVARILINGVSECEGVDGCGAALELSHRTDVELLG
jgi:hypothetical protein